MEECNEKRDGWGEDDTSNKRLDIGRLVGAGSSTGDDEGCWGVRGAKAGACLQPAGKAAPPELTLHPATSPFCAWAGRGQQGPGRGPLPQAPGGLWGAPWAP